MALGAGEHRVADALRLEGVAEGWVGGLLLGVGLEKVSHLMDEAVLIADRQPRHPPVAHVGMVAVGDVNALPTALRPGVGIVEDLEPMKVFEIPLQAHLLAVDLKGVEGLVAAGVAGALEQAERTVGEVTEEGAGVVDGHRLHLAGEGVHPLLDERLGHRRDVGDGAIEPQRRVDAVGEEIAGHAASGGGGIEPPQRCPPLGEIGADRPILEELGPVMEHAPEPAGIDELLGVGHGRDAPVVVPNSVGHPRLLDRRHHLFPFSDIHREGLLAEDRLAVLRRFDGDFGMEVVRRADVDRVDVVGSDELPPVGLDAPVAPALGEGLRLLRITGRHRLEDGEILEVEEVPYPLVAVGVGPAHEAVADHADAEGFCHGWSAFDGAGMGGNGKEWEGPVSNGRAR